jgi:hypothetical protein
MISRDSFSAVSRAAFVVSSFLRSSIATVSSELIS